MLGIGTAYWKELILRQAQDDETDVMRVAQLDEVKRSWVSLSKTVQVPHTEKQYRALVTLLDTLVDEVGENEKHPLASLMEVIGVLIEKYEDEHVPELRSR